jgi:DNA-binding MarR family transcriptional regulator
VAGNLTVTLFRISQAINSLIREEGRAHGLSPTQLQALIFLTYSRQGVRTIGGLAQRLGCTPATASGVADVLERKGLIVREPWPQRRRTITVTLTSESATLAAQMDSSLNQPEAIVCELAPRDQELAAEHAARPTWPGRSRTDRRLRDVLEMRLLSTRCAS